MNSDRLRQLYEQGVKQYKVLEFEVQDNWNWAQTSASGSDYRKEHFDWLKELLAAMQSDRKAAYSASKIIKQLKFETNPSDYWLTDNPDSLTCANLYSDTGIVLSELEQYLDNVTDMPSPAPTLTAPKDASNAESPDADIIQQQAKYSTNKVKFDSHASVLSFGNKVCQIPDESLEYYICKFVFKNRRIAAKEDDILEKTVKSQNSQRAVYDAMLRVNKKSREQLGIDKLLQYRAAKIRIVGKYQ